MSLKDLIMKNLISIPHISTIFDRRVHGRYEPRDGLKIEFADGKNEIYAKLIDIGFGGMKIVSKDDHISNLHRIVLTIEDNKIEFPCRKIRKTDYFYGIIFKKLDSRTIDNLENIIELYMKKPSVYLTTMSR